MRRPAAVVLALAGVFLLTTGAAAQTACGSSPLEIGIPAEVAERAAASVGSLSKPDQDTTDEDTFDEQLMNILTLDRVAFVIADGVIATAANNVDTGPHEYIYRPSSGAEGARCFAAAENDALDLAFLRCEGDLGEPLVPTDRPLVAGDPAFIAGGVAGLLEVPERPQTGVSFELGGGAMGGTPVLDAEGSLVGITGTSSSPIIEVTGQMLECSTTPVRSIDDLGDEATSVAGLPSSYGRTMLQFLGIRAGVLTAVALVFAALRNRFRGYPFHRNIVGWVVFGVLVASTLTGIQYVVAGVAGRTW